MFLTNKYKIVIGTGWRVEKVKGIKYLLLSMKAVLTKFPNARLEIVGDGSQAIELSELSKILELVIL